MIFFTVRKSNHKRYPNNNSADLYIMKALWEPTWDISSDHQNKINQRLFLSTDCTDTFVSERPFVKPLLMVGDISSDTLPCVLYAFYRIYCHIPVLYFVWVSILNINVFLYSNCLPTMKHIPRCTIKFNISIHSVVCCYDDLHLSDALRVS